MNISQKVNNQVKKFIRYRQKLEASRLYRINSHCEKVWYGNLYGGFYINPIKLSKDSIVYSFGIGEDISFDLDVIQNHQCEVFGFDPTPKSISWIGSQNLPPSFHFRDYGIGISTGEQKFHLPKNPNYVSGSALSHSNVNEDDIISVPMKCMEDITKELGHKYIDVFKMDIEGSEYEVLDSILRSNIQVGQFLIEFHDRFFIDGFKRNKMAINLLKTKGYLLFAISNRGEELSFISKSLI